MTTGLSKNAPGVVRVSSLAVRRAVVLTGLVVLLCGVSLVRMCVGQTWGWPEGSVVDATQHLFLDWTGWDGGLHQVGVLDIRLLRLVLAIWVGVALSVGGVALQALLRNPLAEPFILGLSSGAAVGIMTQKWASLSWQLPLGSDQTAALLGSLLSMSVVYLASRKRGIIDPLGLLLVGVVLGVINGALIMTLDWLAGTAGLRAELSRWMMGYLDEGAISGTIALVVATTAAGTALIWQQGRAMDVSSFSDAEAVSMGVNLRRLRVILFVVSGALAAGAVVLGGPIAFVGLVSPHLARLLLGPTHRTLVIGSALVGAAILVLADAASVALSAGRGRLPLGVFTALIGGPVFIAMLKSQLGRGRQA